MLFCTKTFLFLVLTYRTQNATTPTLTGAEEGNFVFGENLGDRVTSTTKSPNNTPEDNAKSPAGILI